MRDNGEQQREHWASAVGAAPEEERRRESEEEDAARISWLAAHTCAPSKSFGMKSNSSCATTFVTPLGHCGHRSMARVSYRRLLMPSNLVSNWPVRVSVRCWVPRVNTGVTSKSRTRG